MFFGLAGIAAAAMAFQLWRQAPRDYFAAFLAVLAAAFLGGVAMPTMWRRSVLFIADDRGMYFPCNELVVATRGRENPGTWLFVPWSNVSNLRLAQTNADGTATCVALDLKVSPVEQAGFFERVAWPTDRARTGEGDLAVAWDANPPSPKRAVDRLLKLSTGRR